MKKLTFLLLSMLLLVSCGPTPEQIAEPVQSTVAVISTATATATKIIEPTISITDTVTVTPTENPTPKPTDTLVIFPTDTLTPIPTETRIPLNSCIPAGVMIEYATVTNIVDGDTIDVVMGGKQFRVRYIGIDTPERERPLYEEALKANSGFVLNKEVALIKDVSETDSFDRLLRYVFVGDIFVNYEMVNLGLAVAEDYPPDSACASTLSASMNSSRTSQIGIWEATQTPEPSAPMVVIIDVNKKAEYVDVQNQGISDVDLSGWNLLSETGNQDCTLYGILKAGETLRIWSMAGDGTGFSCGHGSDIWNNSKSDPAVLYNPEFVEVSRK